MNQYRTIFATDSELGHYGLGGPAAYLARALHTRTGPALILARSAPKIGSETPHVVTMGKPWWRRIAESHHRMRFLIPDQASDRLRFDAWASRRLQAADVVLAENTTSVSTLRAAQDRGCRSILMYYNRSFRQMILDVEEERRRWGGPPTFMTEDLANRAEVECKMADRVVGMSKMVLDDLMREGVPREKLRRARYGVDCTRFRPMEDSKTSFVVAFVGWLEPRKGYPYLVEAFRDAALPRSELLLHGGTGVPFHHELVDRLKGGAQVRVVHGPVEETYRKASVVVLPSVTDAYGLVISEAMASGVPVIVSDRCGAAEDVEDGVHGFVVPARDSHAIQGALTRLYSDPDLRRRMGSAGRDRALQLDWRHFESDCVTVVNELSEPRRTA